MNIFQTIQTIDKIKLYLDKLEKSTHHSTYDINQRYRDICGVSDGNSLIITPICVALNRIEKDHSILNESILGLEKNIYYRLPLSWMRQFLDKDEFETYNEYLKRIADIVNKKNLDEFNQAKSLYNMMVPHVKRFHKILSVEKPLIKSDSILGDYYANDELFHVGIRLPSRGGTFMVKNKHFEDFLFKIPKRIARESIGNIRKGNYFVNISFRIKGISKVKKGKFPFSSVQDIVREKIDSDRKWWSANTGPLEINKVKVELIDTKTDHSYSDFLKENTRKQNTRNFFRSSYNNKSGKYLCELKNK
jgi:hypothetical protein